MCYSNFVVNHNLYGPMSTALVDVIQKLSLILAKLIHNFCFEFHFASIMM